jgi:hypothetical protein
MPPHCDSLDGPVATAARHALEQDAVEVVLAYVPASAEDEVRSTFEAVLPVRRLGHEARLVAERLFLETVVRLHREGEGAPFTGLRPAGLDVGPVIPLAERAIELGDAAPVDTFLAGVLHDELHRRLAQVTELAARRTNSVADDRAYVSAMLGFEVYSHHVFQAMHTDVHEHSSSEANEHRH